MEDLQDRLVGEELLQIRRLFLPGGDLHHVGGAVAGRELHDAEPVAVRVETHGLGVDRHRALVGAEVGQIAAMQADGHSVIGFGHWCPGKDSNLHASRR